MQLYATLEEGISQGTTALEKLKLLPLGQNNSVLHEAPEQVLVPYRNMLDRR